MSEYNELRQEPKRKELQSENYEQRGQQQRRTISQALIEDQSIKNKI
jgi:hypothetical protein